MSGFPRPRSPSGGPSLAAASATCASSATKYCCGSRRRRLGSGPTAPIVLGGVAWVESAAMFEGGLAELHTHLGGSVASDIMWSLAHEQGIALPTRDYWEFDRLVTVSDPRGVPDLDSLDRIYHLTELIQSSPTAVERSVHAAIGGAYRSQGITTFELRFNPMKRNRGGERDLDHIILAAARGLDVASLEYPQVRAGLILMMDRTFTADQNMVIVEKAIRYAARGIVGVDIAGPRRDDPRRRGGRRARHRGDRRGRRVAAAGPDRARHPRGARRGADGGDPACRRHARGLPHVEPAHEGAARRGRRTRHVPHVRRARRAVHDRDRRAGDDADAPARRVRPAAADRRARRRRASRRQRPRARGGVRRAARGGRVARHGRTSAAWTQPVPKRVSRGDLTNKGSIPDKVSP